MAPFSDPNHLAGQSFIDQWGVPLLLGVGACLCMFVFVLAIVAWRRHIQRREEAATQTADNSYMVDEYVSEEFEDALDVSNKTHALRSLTHPCVASGVGTQTVDLCTGMQTVDLFSIVGNGVWQKIQRASSM